jgi:UDP-N-acetylmuramoyl-tripeptide--D-alanyl-D-alanine ligase
MVELGAAHDAEHAKLGALAAQHVDVLVPVVPQRLTAFIDAYRSHAPAGLIVPQPTMHAALAWLETQVQAGDAVLIENDLPDLYENTLRL